MAVFPHGCGHLQEYLAWSWAQRMQAGPSARGGVGRQRVPLPRVRRRFTVSGTIREQDH